MRFLKIEVLGLVVESPQCLVPLGMGVVLEELRDQVLSFLRKGEGEGGRGEWLKVHNVLYGSAWV